MFLTSRIRDLVVTEYQHWQQLSDRARALLASITVYEFMYPILHTFVNSFLLRRLDQTWYVALYNLGIFVSLPATFFVNGWLLRRVKIQWLYGLGIIGQPLVVLMLFWFSWQSWWQLIGIGAVQGILWGWYWSNRNFLRIETTTDSHRNFFMGIEMMLVTLATVVTPFVVGWFIKGAELIGWGTVDQAYQWLGLGAVVVLSLMATWVVRTGFSQPTVSKIWVTNPSRTWQAARWVEVWRGIRNGIDLFLPALLVFQFLGEEGILGTTQSLAALISAGLLYWLGRQVKVHQRYHYAQAGYIVLLVAMVLVSALFNGAAVLMYLLVADALIHWCWLASSPIAEQAIEHQDEGDPTTNYAYVADRELFLNVGRIGGVLVFGLVSTIFDLAVAMRVMMLVMGLSHLGLLYFLKKMV